MAFLDRLLGRAIEIPETGEVGALAAAPQGSERPPSGEIGKEHDDEGRGRYGWLLNDREINPDLQGHLRYYVYDAMVMGDPVVTNLMWSWVQPIAQAEWSVPAAGENPVDLLVAEALDWNFGVTAKRTGRPGGQLRGGWRSLLADRLTCLRYGSSSAEIVWGDPVEWIDSDGDAHLIRPIIRLAPRWPHTIIEYGDPGKGDRGPVGFIQQENVERPIPGRKLVHTVLQPEGGPDTGTAMLRPAYTPWKLKREMLVSAALGFDRFASGVPLVYYPQDDDKEKAHQIGRSFRNHERSYAAFRGPKPNKDMPQGWEIDILNGAPSLADPIPQLRHYDEQIVSAGMARFLQLGSTETGSRAVGEVLAEPFYLSLNAVAHLVAADLAEQVFARFVEVNFGLGIETPYPTPAKIQQRNLVVVGNFIDAAAGAGVRFDDRVAQDEMRALVDVDPLPEDEPTGREGTGPVVIPPRVVEPTDGEDQE